MHGWRGIDLFPFTVTYQIAVCESEKKKMLKTKSINMSVMIWVSMRLQCQSGDFI